MKDLQTGKSGQPGTKKLAARFGDGLSSVGYRDDPVHGLRYTTVELIIDAVRVAMISRRPNAHPAAADRVFRGRRPS